MWRHEEALLTLVLLSLTSPGADRPAVGQGQMSSAFNSLADKVSSTADGMEAAVRLVNGINVRREDHP